MKKEKEIEQLANDYGKSVGNTDGTTAFDFKLGYSQCQRDMADKKYTEEDILKYAWFLVENIGQYACDKTANFEGKYLEQFKNKQD